MSGGEYRPRKEPLLNPETTSALLRRLVVAWDGDDREAFVAALAEARALIALKKAGS